jgi:diguanylate cyclase (GGDEF)-like protein
MRLSSRYSMLGMLVGLLAPAGLFLYGIATRQTFDPVWCSAVLAAGGTVVFAIVGRMIGRRDETLLARNQELAVLSNKLRELSTIDALTGIHNRRSFDDRLNMTLAQTRRYGVPCALVMIDLDRFKSANDRHGHQAGDEVLRHIAALLDGEKRTGDMIARYGGEELAAILPHTNAADAFAWAERVRARIEGEPTRWHDIAVRITASFGVAAAPPHEGNAEELIEAADRALYVAKERGGNAVVVTKGAVRADWRGGLSRARTAS